MPFLSFNMEPLSCPTQAPLHTRRDYLFHEDAVQMSGTHSLGSSWDRRYLTLEPRSLLSMQKYDTNKSSFNLLRILPGKMFIPQLDKHIMPWEKVLAYKVQPRKKESLLTCLSDLFNSIATQKKKMGVISPKKFISRLRKENELFDNYMQQDAHEFLNYLLNTIADLLQEEKKEEKQNGKLQNGSIESEEGDEPDLTWAHEIFQGTLTNETRRLNCEAVSSKDEDFLDLLVDVEQNTSITHCLRGFSNTETLCSERKHYREQCRSKQEAQKRMRLKKLPMILALHLKRFKYMDQLQGYTKLPYRVVFPLELQLFNTSGDATNPDRMYDLVAVVVHCGSGPNHGHYITIVKSHGFWLLFDDDIVEKIDAQAIEEFYGLTSDISKNSESGYILFYQSKD